MRTKKNAGQPRFFRRRKRTRLASRSDLGGSSRCHNRFAFLALTDVGVMLMLVENMAAAAMKKKRNYSKTNEKCRYKSRFPKPSPIWKVAPTVESTLVSARCIGKKRRHIEDVQTPCRYKRRFPSPRPIWKVATTKGESALVSARARQKNRRKQTNNMLIKGRLTNELLLQT